MSATAVITMQKEKIWYVVKYYQPCRSKNEIDSHIMEIYKAKYKAWNRLKELRNKVEGLDYLHIPDSDLQIYDCWKKVFM